MPRSEATLSPLAVRIAAALREADPEGLTLPELEGAVGSRYVRRVMRAMCYRGYNIGEMGGRYVLVVEPKDREASGAPPHLAPGTSQSPLRLFDVAPDVYSEAA